VFLFTVEMLEAKPSFLLANQASCH